MMRLLRREVKVPLRNFKGKSKSSSPDSNKSRSNRLRSRNKPNDGNVRGLLFCLNIYIFFSNRPHEAEYFNSSGLRIYTALLFFYCKESCI